MSEEPLEISLLLENPVISAMITMFGTLKEVKNDKEATISDDQKSIKIRSKEKDEIISFNFDYSDLEDKIFNWFHIGQKFLHLNEEETEIFKKCPHATYYFLLENKKGQKNKLRKILLRYCMDTF